MLDLTSSLKDKLVSGCMTSPVVTVGPDDPARKAAELMLRHKISGLPVVDGAGRPLGVISESDFLFGDAETRRKQRESWVDMLSGGQHMAGAYPELLEKQGESVRTLMAKPAICIDESCSILEAGEIMSRHRIKRLPVLRDGLVAGVVTRTNLLRFFAPEETAPRPVTPELFDSALLDLRKKAPKAPAPAEAAEVSGDLTAQALKDLVNEFERNKSRFKDEAGRLAREGREALVRDLLHSRYEDRELAALLSHAREAARRGESSIPALVFPSALCTDGGRAINLPDPQWPATLRGKAADFFLRWDKELKPLGFALSARIVNFPDGFPGDAELALFWGR
jgi:CBS domain-containing protein